MKTKSKISEMLKTDAKQAKKLFNLCEKNGNGIYNKLHIIKNSRFPDTEKEYRVYHSNGYCFDVSKEKIDLAEDESCDSSINGYEYCFNEGAYEGFKELSVDEAVNLLEEI